MSATYFALSLGVLLAAAQASLLLKKWSPQAADALALRGAASFALIPVHYLLIGIVSAAMPGWVPMSPSSFAVLVAIAVVISFVVSDAFARSLEGPAVRQQRAWLAPSCLGLVLASTLAAIVWKGGGHLTAMAQLFIGQMAVAAYLALGSAQRPFRSTGMASS